MARPRLAVPFDDIIDAYQRTGSVRGASELLTISRWAVERRLEEAGIPILDRDAALAQVRLLRANDRAPRRVEERTTRLGSGVIGCTVVTVRRHVAYSPCSWPGCEVESEVGRSLCGAHSAIADAAPGCGCAWPGCHQEVVATACCSYHDKVAHGLTECSQTA